MKLTDPDANKLAGEWTKRDFETLDRAIRESRKEPVREPAPEPESDMAPRVVGYLALAVMVVVSCGAVWGVLR